jgi:glycosyltransferase involved in cell wall biosynthesis
MSNQTMLSILIPARHEEFLAKTIENILENIEAETEVIVVLDGEPSMSPLPEDPRVHVISVSKAFGQRAATNLAARMAVGKFLMKVDAHCSFDKGFDRKMLDMYKVVGDDVTMVPIMRNLWAFDFKCFHCGWKAYQGNTPEKCGQCGKTDRIRKKIMWVGKSNPQSTSFCFDSEPHFQYFESHKHKEPYLTDKKEKGYTETMSIQGSCFMCTKEKYWELRLGDEIFGSWGSQGIQVACSTWLSGGKVIVNHNTWYAHLFRTKGGDFGFPYPQSGRKVQSAKKHAKKLIYEGGWPKQKYLTSWLIRRFSPIPGWSEEDIKKLEESEQKITL